MKTVLTKETKKAFDIISKLNTKNLPIVAADGYLSAIIPLGKIKIAFGDNSLIPDNINTGLSNDMLKYISSFNPGASIEVLAENSNTVTIKAGRSKSRFTTLDKTSIDFKEFDNTQALEVECDRFLEELLNTALMCNTETSAQILAKTIYIKYRSAYKDILIIGTDGSQLLRTIMDCGDGGENDLEVMIPSQSVKIMSMLFKDSEKLYLASTARSLVVTNEAGTRFDFVQNECSYPTDGMYRATTPEETASSFVFDRDALVESVSRCLSLAQGQLMTDFHITLSPQLSELQILCNCSALLFTDSVPIKYEGADKEDKTALFTAKKFLNIIKSFDDEEIKGYLGTYNRGVIFENVIPESASGEKIKKSGCLLPLAKR